ncbi:MAG: DNA-directed DNA polymerase alpha subunit pol12 [Chaenotheca gracillima]|nr:MAG: DNA-directed DNA polymerase alpha subunit pol12 [Chaenotheca gracillima]
MSVPGEAHDGVQEANPGTSNGTVQEQPLRLAVCEVAPPVGQNGIPTEPVEEEPTSVNGVVPTEPNLSNGIPESQEKSSSPATTPFAEPTPASNSDPVPQLTAEQQAKYQDLLNTVHSWTSIPNTSAKNAPTAPITDEEKMWLTRECLLRYLRAVKWNAAEAPKRLLATMTWRREYGVDKLTAEHIAPENETGKQVILGYDLKARPCLYLIPSRQNTKKSDRQVQHLVFMVERVIELMVPGQESLSLLINFKDSNSGEIPSVGQGRQVLNILQSHYPERLGRAYVINLPWFVNGFFKFISPFIDPLTREKLKFNEDLREHVPPSQLLSSMGGDVEFAYDHSIYWPALNEMAEERRQAQVARWVEGGKHIGESENYIKGGPEKSVSESTATPSAAV